MRIDKIIIKELFGYLTHEINIKTNERITIIHGPNGIGKTILLRMIYGLFNGNYYEIRTIPFKELTIIFNDKSSLIVTKENKDNIKHLEIHLKYQKETKSPKMLILKPVDLEHTGFPFRILEEDIPGIEQIGQETWMYLPTQEKLSLEDVLERFGQVLPPPRISRFPLKKGSETEWFDKIKKELSIRFIEAQRLMSFQPSQSMKKYLRKPQMIFAVVKYSEEIATTIQKILSQYGSISQDLDRTFPARLVKSNTQPYDITTLQEKLKSLEEKRERLTTSSLLAKTEEMNTKDLSIDDQNRVVLSVYVDDVEKKLDVFNEISNKIELFKQIINDRFKYKKLDLNKENGFVFETDDGKPLSAINLSSGEQHELVLFYELLFKVSPNSLILIDEPELSLHVAWQIKFLRDLDEVIKLSPFDVLIATHSPDIIHDRWDLTVALEGTET
ncbi:MAG: AAA family ATPase [Nitrospirae bacterium]|nr:AAA family ATPase [Nitrospirota bacterium]